MVTKFKYSYKFPQIHDFFQNLENWLKVERNAEYKTQVPILSPAAPVVEAGAAGWAWGGAGGCSESESSESSGQSKTADRLV